MRWHPKDEVVWKKHFAVLPVETRCGSTVWMETVWKRLKYPCYAANIWEYAVYEERPDITEDGKDDLT